MRFRAIFLLANISFTSAFAAPVIDKTLDAKLATLVHDAQTLVDPATQTSGVRLELRVKDGIAPTGLSYAIQTDADTPPAVAEGQSGIRPGLYQLTVRKEGREVFRQSFLAAAGILTDLKLSYAAASGFALKQTLDLPQITFKPNQKQLSRESRRDLREIVDFLNEHETIETLGIEVHTDAHGDEQANLELTTYRAIELRNALIKLGIDAQRIRTFGRGSADPRVPNDSLENRRKNRRVEYVILESSAQPRLLGGR